MDFVKLKKILKEKKEPNFRFQQILKNFCDGKNNSWYDFTNLPINLRESLEKEIKYSEIQDSKVFQSKDGTFKAILKLLDGLEIETVLIPNNKSGYTICLSSQIGCTLGCKFCATGKMGFKRSLTIAEAFEQFVFWSRFLFSTKNSSKITGAVWMGMGEPFLNYENIVEALVLILTGYKIHPKHFTISTAGIIEGIKKMQDDPRLKQVNLALSLHASNQEIREKIMPVAKKVVLKDLIEVVTNFAKKTNQKIFVEYLVLNGVNDNEKIAKELVQLLKNPNFFHINLLRYNFTSEDFLKSDETRIRNFQKILLQAGFDSTRRKSFGEDIDGACGQLIVNQN